MARDGDRAIMRRLFKNLTKLVFDSCGRDGRYINQLPATVLKGQCAHRYLHPNKLMAIIANLAIISKVRLYLLACLQQITLYQTTLSNIQRITLSSRS